MLLPSTGYSIPSITALKALAPTDRTDGYTRVVLTTPPAWYTYRSASTLAGDDNNVVVPADNSTSGRWLKTGANLTGAVASSEKGVAGGVASLDDSGSIPDAQISGAITRDTELAQSLQTRIASSEKGAVNGVATLDAAGLIPNSQLPPITITDTFVINSQAAMLALTAQVGDIAVRTDLHRSYILRVAPASVLANWQELETPFDTVLSVNGQTGTVNLTAASVGAQSNLGFTPVQQGGGIGQLTNKVYIGWSSPGNLKVTVDATDLGDLITSNYLAFNPNGFGSRSFASNGYQKLPGGLILQWGQATLSSTNGQDFSTTINYPVTFPNFVLSANFNVRTDGSDLDVRLVGGITQYGPTTSGCTLAGRNIVTPQGTALRIYYFITGY